MSLNKKLLAAALFLALLPARTAYAQTGETLRQLEITMLMDLSRISEDGLAQLVAGAAFGFTLYLDGEDYAFSLANGESALLPLGEGEGQLSLTQTVDAGFIDSYGDPECGCLWAVDAAPWQSAELECEYIYQNKSGRTETVSGAESYRGDGLNSLREKRVSLSLTVPEEGRISLLITNTAAAAEYGALRIDQRAQGESGVFDVLVWLGGSGSGEALPVAAGTHYYHRASPTEPWRQKRVESAGVVPLSDGASAMFPRLPGGASYCVRETKKSARGYLVSYHCNMLYDTGPYAARVEGQGGVDTLTGRIVPCYEAMHSETPDSAVVVSVTNIPGEQSGTQLT